jgi:hypothetical protein
MHELDRRLLEWSPTTAEGGWRPLGDGGSDVNVVIDFLWGKTQGWSEKMCIRDGRGRGKESAELAHGFDGQNAKWRWQFYRLRREILRAWRRIGCRKRRENGGRGLAFKGGARGCRCCQG